MIVPGTALAATSKTWKVAVGAQSRDAGNQANFFFTNKITIDAGDSVTWTSQAGEIHTVSFLAGGPRPDLAIPNTSGPGLVANPAAVAPSCLFTSPPSCGTPQTYDGTFKNSGIVVLGAPAYTLSFPTTTTPGSYDYVCLVHSDMKGTVVVQPQGAAYPRTQASYDVEAAVSRSIALGQAAVNAGRGFAASAGPNKVTAGIGQLFPTTLGSVAVLRFEPDRKVTRVGQAVTWTNLDPETPHTVTFGKEPPSVPDLFALAPPVGEDTPGHATITPTTVTAHSGFIGAGFPGTTFSATFTAPGTYSYICALHDDLGMVGSITVLP
ncbi:MAG TPA: plastocyanin/azurin family copper-binding protein [Chloroflexota bacterium]